MPTSTGPDQGLKGPSLPYTHNLSSTSPRPSVFPENKQILFMAFEILNDTGVN
jgi:hypothetical protein